MHNQTVKMWALPSFGRLQHSESSPAVRASHPSEQGLALLRLLPGGPGVDFVTLGRKTPQQSCVFLQKELLFLQFRESNFDML